MSIYRVTDIRRAAETFDCRRNVLEKTYTYRIALHDYENERVKSNKNIYGYKQELNAFSQMLMSHEM